MRKSVLAVLAVAMILASCVSGGEKDIAVRKISIEPSELKVSIGFTKPLTAVVEPENADYLYVEWKSSDPSIAQVSKRGTVKGIAMGTATVTASVGGVSATCTVTVSERSASVSGVVVSPETLSVGLNGTGEVSAKVEPEDAANENVTWSSSNTQIATVDENGVVTGVAIGECDIIATSEDGGFTDKCHVTVSVIPIEKIYFFNGGDNTIVAEQGSNQTLLVAFEPENASLTNLTWTTDDASLATVESEGKAQGKVTFASGKFGPVVITATAEDGSAVSQTFFVKGAQELYNAPSGNAYAGRRVKYSFNSAYYTQASGISWKIGDKTIQGSEAEFAFESGGDASVVLSATYGGKPINVTFPVKVEEWYINVTLEDKYINPRNTYPVFNKEQTRAYFITRGDKDNGARRLYEIDLEGRKLGWYYDINDPKHDNGGDICVNPNTGDVICSNQTKVFCIKPDGTAKWTLDVANDVSGATSGTSGSATSSFFGCGPAMSNDCSVIFAPIVNKFFALDAATGQILDTFTNGGQGHIQYAVYGNDNLVIHYDRVSGENAIRFCHFSGGKFVQDGDINSPLTSEKGSQLTDICAPAINKDQSVAYFSGSHGRILALDLRNRSVIGIATPADGSGDAYIMQPTLTDDGRMLIPTQVGASIMGGDLSKNFTSTSIWTKAYNAGVAGIFNFMVIGCDTEGNGYFFVNGGSGGLTGFCEVTKDYEMKVIAPLAAKINEYQAVFNFCDGYLVAGGGPNSGNAVILVRCIDAKRGNGWSGAGGDVCATKNANIVYAQ